ncbi:tetratricopeptide repeat protein [Paracoccaceae bacterium GXU_MW_L88]
MKNLMIGAAMLAALAACDNAEERAEKYYQSAVELSDAGEDEKARVELRNVFQLNGEHQDARLLYARLTRDAGNITEAASQFRRLLEQNPEHVDALYELAEIYYIGGATELAEEQLTKLEEVDPDNINAKSIRASIAYNGDDRARGLELAREIQDADPENLRARLILGDDMLEQGDLEGAREVAESMADSESYGAQLFRLSVLEQQDDQEAIGAQLASMLEAAPQNDRIRELRARWLFTEAEDADTAIAVLRDGLEVSPDREAMEQRLVALIQRSKGPEAAEAELKQLASEAEEPLRYLMRAAAIAAGDDQQDAIARLEALKAENEDASLNERGMLNVALARLYLSNGEHEKADEALESILSEDPTRADALVLRGGRYLEENELDLAIADLRQALDTDPQNLAAVNQLATAYQRNGNEDLAREQFARAAEVSNYDPNIVNRYVAFLASQGRDDGIRTVVQQGLDVNPDSVILLAHLGRVAVREANWIEAGEVADRLAALGSDDANALAEELQAAILSGQNDVDELIAQLQSSLEAGTATRTTLPNLISAFVRAGREEDAATYLEGYIEDEPQDPRGYLLRGRLALSSDDNDTAREWFNRGKDAIPLAPEIYLTIASLNAREGDIDAAEAILDEGIETLSNNAVIRAQKARLYEGQGRTDDAIGVYQALHDEFPDNVVYANNLVSLMMDYREGEMSLDDAAEIARPLRDSNVPAFQDTYGWLLFQRDEVEASLAYLGPAADQLVDQPLVQYHAGVAYAELGQAPQARRYLGRAIELAEQQGLDLPQIADARSRLAAIGEN